MEENKALKKFDNLAKKLAGRYQTTYKNKFEFEELYAAARLGIVKASRSYKEDIGVKFITHAYNCANNAIKGYIRDSKVISKVPESDHRSAVIIDNETAMAQLEQAPAEDLIAGQEHRVFLEQALSMLDEKQRRILHLVYFEHMSYEDIAKEFGVSKQSAHQMAFKALEKLRAYVAKHQLEVGDIL